jgi:hypothetical protein
VKIIKYDIKEYTYKQALLRSLLAFIIILFIGGLFILIIYKITYKPIEFKIEKYDFKPSLVSAPNRPKGYSEELPTLDNVALVKIQKSFGGTYYTLISDSTPEKVVEMVLNSFEKDKWKNNTVNTNTALLGSFISMDDLLVGVEITSKPREGYIKGWVTITLLVKNDDVIIFDPLINPEKNNNAKDKIS